MSDAWRFWRSRARRLFRRIIISRHSPQQIAAGVALGVFIGFTPLMGCQMVTAALLATLFGWSRIAAMPMVYVTNPVTAPIIYPACYFFGVWVLSPFGFSVLGVEQVRELFILPKDAGIWGAIWIKMQEIFGLGWDVLAPLWFGCFVLGALCAVPFYYGTLRLVRGHRLRKARRMALRAQQRIERIRQRQKQEQREA